MKKSRKRKQMKKNKIRYITFKSGIIEDNNLVINLSKCLKEKGRIFIKIENFTSNNLYNNIKIVTD